MIDDDWTPDNDDNLEHYYQQTKGLPDQCACEVCVNDRLRFDNTFDDDSWSGYIQLKNRTIDMCLERLRLNHNTSRS